jgi:hypothetical protein
MARVVMGIGMSHSPLLALPGERWTERGRDDRANPGLNTFDGRLVDYDTVNSTVKDRYADIAIVENFVKQEDQAQRALDRLADDFAKIRPDVCVIIGDDHYELFSPANMPAIAIYHGKEILTHEAARHEDGSWRNTVAAMYAMDHVHTYPAQAELAEKLIEQLIERDFDIGSAARVDDPKTLGFGHAYGFVAERIFRGREVPIVPVMLNTYFPPNAPTPRRCYNLGMAIKESLEAIPMDLRVAVVGSGGLSHFIVEEEFDRQILKALETHDEDVLRTLPVNALKSGSSEIRCWIAAGGAFRGLKHQWSEYIPARRTPAGTGIGLGFATWY